METPSLVDDEKTDGAAGLTQKHKKKKNTLDFSPVDIQQWRRSCRNVVTNAGRVVWFVMSQTAGLLEHRVTQKRENLPQSPESLSTGGGEEEILHRAHWAHLGWEMWPQRSSCSSISSRVKESKYNGLGFLFLVPGFDLFLKFCYSQQKTGVHKSNWNQQYFKICS